MLAKMIHKDGDCRWCSKAETCDRHCEPDEARCPEVDVEPVRTPAASCHGRY